MTDQETKIKLEDRIRQIDEDIDDLVYQKRIHERWLDQTSNPQKIRGRLKSISEVCRLIGELQKTKYELQNPTTT